MDKRNYNIIFLISFIFFCFSISRNIVFSQNDDTLMKANGFYQQEDYQSAVLLLNGLLKTNSGNKSRKTDVVEAYYLLAKIYFEIRDDSKMEKALAEIFKLVPDFSKNETNVAFKNIFEKNKNNPLAKAMELYIERDFGNAIPLLNKYLIENQSKIDEKNNVADAFYLLAKIYYQKRDDQKMYEVLSRLFSLIPDYAYKDSNPGFKKVLDEMKNNQLLKAFLLYHQGEYAEVISFLNEYIPQADKNHNHKRNIPQAYYLLAKTYFKLKEKNRMTDSLIKLFELAPDFSQEETDADFEKVFNQIKGDPLYLARDFFSKRLLDEALSFLKDFIMKNVKNKDKSRNVAEAYYLIAKIHYQLRDDVNMGAALRRTFEIDPEFSFEEPNPDFKEKVARLKKELATKSN